ncbi:MAG: response regulator [Flavobacteriaceae bacterium]|nr:response regulator [Flavobacteriaceae bacterium]
MIKEKLNCILLVDDDESTNFLHRYVVEKTQYAKKCVTVHSGQEALDYLTSTEEGEHPQPDLVFLDINMPAMNGWEFLEHYKQLDKNQQGKVVVVMLTTSINPDDREKSKLFSDVTGFKNKPLTKEMILELIKEHFPEKI